MSLIFVIWLKRLLSLTMQLTWYSPEQFDVSLFQRAGDAVAKWLERWTPDREIQVRALAGSLCCFLGQDTLLSQCFPPPRSKWVPANCQGNLTKCWVVTCDGLVSHPGAVAIILVVSCYRNRDKLRQ